jgi:hypothetical protein
MQVHVKRAFNLQIGSYANYGDLHETLLQIGPGVVALPDEAVAHWYFAANVHSGNVTVLEQIDASSGETEYGQTII